MNGLNRKIKPKKQTKDKTVRMIFLLVMYAVLAVFIAVLFVFNSQYTNIYKSPQVKNGRVFSDRYMPQYDWSII